MASECWTRTLFP
ncbi:UNVERIFIED_CONTAM: hypothetical protein GTU68_049745 [Idotea baltica]|nr:hypothetical protein [Idotea baltica]